MLGWTWFLGQARHTVSLLLSVAASLPLSPSLPGCACFTQLWLLLRYTLDHTNNTVSTYCALYLPPRPSVSPPLCLPSPLSPHPSVSPPLPSVPPSPLSPLPSPLSPLPSVTPPLCPLCLPLQSFWSIVTSLMSRILDPSQPSDSGMMSL